MIFITAGECKDVNREMCQKQELYDLILRTCPHTCGLCDKAGAANKCPDTIKDCDVLVKVAGCDDATVKKLCQGSCNSLDCLKGLFLVH